MPSPPQRSGWCSASLGLQVPSRASFSKRVALFGTLIAACAAACCWYPGAGSRFVGTSMHPQAMSSRTDLVELSSLLRARARQGIRPRPCASCTSEPFGGARAPQEGGRASAALRIVSGCTLDGSGRPRRGDLCLLPPLKAISATESRAGAGAARGWSRENSPSG